jgi:hypothetical protein
MSVHIYPLHDTNSHTLSSDCGCQPKQNSDGYWLHTSYDGREDHPDNGSGKLKWTFDISETDEQ